MSRKAKGPVKINLRIEPDLHQRLQEATSQNGNSLQVEITARLEQSFGNHLSPQVQNIMHQVATSAVTEAFKVVGLPPPDKRGQK